MSNTGVKEYKLTYYTPEYQTKDTDILAAFRVTPQPGVPPKEAGAAVGLPNLLLVHGQAVWTDGLTRLDRYKGRCYRIERVVGEKDQYIAYVAYPLDLFEEGSVTNMFTSIVRAAAGFALGNLLHVGFHSTRDGVGGDEDCHDEEKVRTEVSIIKSLLLVASNGSPLV
ncbi:hypothetical protein RND71_038465 [Anisodus tanguticus]|uniref:Ribulose bisphosphate carboxylase large chain n=1 Tax=Anisodus tanguticus TaxID=243964 RepID=A0AAE1R0R4_9SOLA|nr:hypothetical protein RND71_038465 [Anisodus tanguticus]